eukprot:5991528-Prymnesium_polylepis.1
MSSAFCRIAMPMERTVGVREELQLELQRGASVGTATGIPPPAASVQLPCYLVIYIQLYGCTADNGAGQEPLTCSLWRLGVPFSHRTNNISQ